MTRAHLYRPLQDAAGNLQRGATVRLFRAGTNELVNSNLYTTDEGEETYTQPISCPTGFLSVYLDAPRRFRIGITPFGGGTEVIFENIDTDIPTQTAVQTPVDPIQGLTSLDVQSALAELQGTKYGPGNDLPAYTASEVAFSPYGTYLFETLDVQVALQTFDDAVSTFDGRLDLAEADLVAHDGRLDVLEGAETVADHEAKTDPHPQYLTAAEGDDAFLTQAEGDARYATPGSVPAANPFQSTFGSPKPLATTRTPGDLHYDTALFQEFVVTGAPGSTTAGTLVYRFEQGASFAEVTLTSTDGQVFDFSVTTGGGSPTGNRVYLCFRTIGTTITETNGVTMFGTGDALTGSYDPRGNAKVMPYEVFFKDAGTSVLYPMVGGETFRPAPGTTVPDTRTWTSTDQYVAPHTHGQLQTFSTKTASYTLTATDGIVFFNGTDLTATLPTPVGRTGVQFTVKNLNVSPLTVTTTAGTIDGDATRTLAQYDSLTVVSDGTNWGVL